MLRYQKVQESDQQCFAELKNLGITDQSLFVLIESWLNFEHIVKYFKTFILEANNLGFLVYVKNFLLVGCWAILRCSFLVHSRLRDRENSMHQLC
jgi:hypothetical protein